jgi:hypothetical protein
MVSQFSGKNSPKAQQASETEFGYESEPNFGYRNFPSSRHSFKSHVVETLFPEAQIVAILLCFCRTECSCGNSGIAHLFSAEIFGLRKPKNKGINFQIPLLKYELKSRSRI